MKVHIPKFPGMVQNRAPDDVETFVRILAEAGYDPVAAAAIVELESARTWSPKVRGPRGAFKMPPGYPVGLIQFSPDTAKALGTSTAKLENMSFVEQAALIPRYYRKFFGGPERFTRPADYYAAGWGNGVGASETYVLAESGTQAYATNPALDRDKDGKITVGDLSATVTSMVSAAAKNGYWVFDLSETTLAGVRARYALAGPLQAAEIFAILKWTKL